MKNPYTKWLYAMIPMGAFVALLARARWDEWQAGDTIFAVVLVFAIGFSLGYNLSSWMSWDMKDKLR